MEVATPSGFPIFLLLIFSLVAMSFCASWIETSRSDFQATVLIVATMVMGITSLVCVIALLVKALFILFGVTL